MRFAAFATIALSVVLVDRCRATMLTLPLTASAQATSPDGDSFFIAAPTDRLFTSYSASQERRTILEFGLGTLPRGASIQFAQLNFSVSDAQSKTVGSTTLFPAITFYAYAGDNVASPADASHTSDDLATEMLNDTGPWTIDLDAGRVNSYVAAPALGILMYAQSTDLTLGIWTTPAPTLDLTFTLPGDANSNGRIDPDDFTLTDRGFANHLAGWDNGDFNADGSVDSADYLLLDQSFAANGGAFSATILAARELQFGSGYLVALPEPASLGLLAVAFPLSRRRR